MKLPQIVCREKPGPMGGSREANGLSRETKYPHTKGDWPSGGPYPRPSGGPRRRPPAAAPAAAQQRPPAAAQQRAGGPGPVAQGRGAARGAARRGAVRCGAVRRGAVRRACAEAPVVPASVYYHNSRATSKFLACPSLRRLWLFSGLLCLWRSPLAAIACSRPRLLPA